MNADQDRIAAKAHELWQAEGQPHGRDQDHWDQAKEIVALEDSATSALLPREAGAQEPVEEKTVAIDNVGEAPSLTDTGEHDLTAIDREPAITAPPRKAAAKKARTDAARTSPAIAPKTPGAKRKAK